MPGFLEHLLPWVDEIVIVDDGSTDRTVDMARKAGRKVKVIEHRMVPEKGFSGQRNVGLREAESDWILHMDIDERVTPVLAQEIRQAIPGTQKNAFQYHRLNFFLHRPMKAGGWQEWNRPQLARNGRHHFVNVIHERCVIEGEPDSVGQLKSSMWHLNDESYGERMEKSFRYCQAEAEIIIGNGKQLSRWDVVCAPIWEFTKKYLLKTGFRDGVPGLIAAVHSGCAVFRAQALAWDSQNRIERTELERAINTQWINTE